MRRTAPHQHVKATTPSACLHASHTPYARLTSVVVGHLSRSSEGRVPRRGLEGLLCLLVVRYARDMSSHYSVGAGSYAGCCNVQSHDGIFQYFLLACTW